MDADRDVVARQIGREPRAFRRVAVRCPFGRPAITEQSPYDSAGDPFPTTYYVTCRHLVADRARVDVIFPWIRDGRLVTDRKDYLANRVLLRERGLLVTGRVLRTWSPAARSRRNKLRPSSFGNIQSRINRSGCSRLTASSATSPSNA